MESGFLERNKFFLACLLALLIVSIYVVLLYQIISDDIMLAMMFFEKSKYADVTMPSLWPFICALIMRNFSKTNKDILWLFEARTWRIRKTSCYKKGFIRLKRVMDSVGNIYCKVFDSVLAISVLLMGIYVLKSR